jgi:uncharacterized membrane protein YkvI
MKTFFYRIFYCIFVGLKRSMKENDKAIAFMSALMFSYLLIMNCFTLLLLLKMITNIHVPLFWVILSLPILSSLYFLKKKKYHQIKTMFNFEERKVKNKRKTLCVLYIVLSFVVNIILLYVTEIIGYK